MSLLFTCSFVLSSFCGIPMQFQFLLFWKAVNSPKMDRLLGSTCQENLRSALNQRRRIHRCKEVTLEWPRTSKRPLSHLIIRQSCTEWSNQSRWQQEHWTANREEGHASRTHFFNNWFWRIFIVLFWTIWLSLKHNRLSAPELGDRLGC